MRSLTSLFPHDFLLHVPQDETHFNPCLRQEQIHIKIFCFQPYTCILQTGVDVMVRDQSQSWLVPGSFHWVFNPSPMDQDLFFPLIPMSWLVDVLLDYDNSSSRSWWQLLRLNITLAVMSRYVSHLNTFKIAWSLPAKQVVKRELT